MATIGRVVAPPDGWTRGGQALAGALLTPPVAVAWMALFRTENFWPDLGANALVDLPDYAGLGQAGLRALFGWQEARDYQFGEIRSIKAAGFVLG